MYNLSQISCGYAGSCSCSPLESIASAKHYENTAYSASVQRDQRGYSGRVVFPLFYGLPHSLPHNQDYSLSVSSQSYNLSDDKYQLFTLRAEYDFMPDNFLLPGKGGKFVGQAEEVREFVEETFCKIFAEPLPDNIKISVLNENQFRKIAPSAGTIGLSINRARSGLLSEIFVLNDTLGKIMLTLGHELGHVLTECLDNRHDEEAKAYAFSLIWMKTIKEHNIAGLGDAVIIDSPANNGLHDLAFGFVRVLINEGKKAWDIYNGLVHRLFSFYSYT